jgi:hypothetical protein
MCAGVSIYHDLLPVEQDYRRAMNFVTIADLEDRVTEAVLGFEQHGFGVAVLRVRCDPTLGESVYFPPCTADPDLALILWPGERLTQAALVEATCIYLHRSGELGPVRGEVNVCRWAPLEPCPRLVQDAQPVKHAPNEMGPVFLHPSGEIRCEVINNGCR